MTGLPEKIALLGGRGMLGSDVAIELKSRGIDFEVFDLPDFDITNEHHLVEIFKSFKTIINCAAYTNVDKAESETELAFKINAEAVGRLAYLARKHDAWILHISTDFVFDGNGSAPYTEKDIPQPINAYGRTKLAGEQLLAENHAKFCIIRVEWTYGMHGDNFVKKILARVQTQKELKVVDDQFGSPTATFEAAKVICDFLQKKPRGIYHFASQGYASRFEVAQFIIDTLKLNVTLKPCKTADFPAPAVRPLNSRFDCSKIRTIIYSPIKNWQIPLEEFLQKLSEKRS